MIRVDMKGRGSTSYKLARAGKKCDQLKCRDSVPTFSKSGKISANCNILLKFFSSKLRPCSVTNFRDNVTTICWPYSARLCSNTNSLMRLPTCQKSKVRELLTCDTICILLCSMSVFISLNKPLSLGIISFFFATKVILLIVHNNQNFCIHLYLSSENDPITSPRVPGYW